MEFHMDRKEAVRLLSQAMYNLRENYLYREQTWEAFGALNINNLGNTAYKLDTFELESGIVIQKWQEKPFVRFDPTIVQGDTSSYVGQINVSYKDLCRVFGKHDKWHDGYKSDASWNIEFKDGTFAHISNFKDGHTYLGRKGKNLADIKVWDVHGTDKSIKLIKQSLDYTLPNKERKCH
jgi:hypothetical protein